jgi:hypothetical protein
MAILAAIAFIIFIRSPANSFTISESGRSPEWPQIKIISMPRRIYAFTKLKAKSLIGGAAILVLDPRRLAR